MGILASAKAALLPKEAFTDEGWRKIFILAIANVGLFGLMITVLIVHPDKLKALEFCWSILYLLLPADGMMMGYNVWTKLKPPKDGA